MKTIFLLVLFMAVLPASAQQSLKARPAQPAAGLSTGGLSGGTLPSGLAPKPPATPAPPPAPVILYLKERISVPTNDGIVALPPGTAVTVLGKLAGTMKVEAEGWQFDVLATQVTPSAPKSAAVREPRTSNGLEPIERPQAGQPLPPPANLQPGHARIWATVEDFRHTPGLVEAGSGCFQMDTWTVTPKFWGGRCHELTFFDYPGVNAEQAGLIRQAKQAIGKYAEFYAAVLDANRGDSTWSETTVPGYPNRSWKRDDGAICAEQPGPGLLTLTTTELKRSREKQYLDSQRRLLEGL